MGHRYVDIATALNPTADLRRTVNLFGVIIDCRAPCTTNGGDLRCEIVLADESCVQPDGSLRKFFVHKFVTRPSDAIPFRQLGDIVRIHRASLIDYSGYGKPTVRQGRLKFYSTVLLWKHEANDFVPVLQQCPAHRDLLEPPPSPAPVDIHDKFRIRRLRGWTKDFFFTQYKSERQYLRTVPEILNASNGTIFLSKSFDLICYVRQCSSPESENNLVMTVTGGERTFGTSILISSRQPWKARGVPQTFSFFDFCPSWSTRPTNGSWLLIRDVRVVDTGRGREIELSVSGRTSTLIWNADNSPDVRAARERGIMQQPNAQQNVTVPRAVVRVRPPPHSTPKRPRSNTAEDILHRNLKAPRHDRHITATTSENNYLRTRNVVPYNTGAGPPPLPDDAVSRAAPGADNHLNTALATLAEPNPPLKHDYHLAIVPAPDGVSDAGRDQGAHIGIELAPHDKIVTVHSRTDQKVWRIGDMVYAFRRGSGEKLFRLAVWARAIVWPRDLRHACRPICAKCEKGVLMIGNNCDGCGSDRKLWQFVLRLLLEERSAGASIESWVIGKDAERLLGLQASDLRMNDTKCTVLRQKLRTLHAAINVVDCLVVPYEYEDDMGLYRVACVLKGTRLLS